MNTAITDHFIPFLLCAALFAGCAKNETIIDLSINPSECVIPGEGGTTCVLVTAPGNWSFIGAPDWIEVKPKSGNAASEPIAVSFTAAKNDYDARTTSLSLVSDSKTISISIRQNAVTVKETGEEETVAAVSIEDFLSKSSGSASYRICGIISGIDNATDGVLTLTDGTGSVLVDGVTASPLGYDSANDKSFASLNVSAGDSLTVDGFRGSVGETNAMLFASYVSSAANKAVSSDFSVEGSYYSSVLGQSYKTTLSYSSDYDEYTLILPYTLNYSGGIKFVFTLKSDGTLSMVSGMEYYNGYPYFYFSSSGYVYVYLSYSSLDIEKGSFKLYYYDSSSNWKNDTFTWEVEGSGGEEEEKDEVAWAKSGQYYSGLEGTKTTQVLKNYKSGKYSVTLPYNGVTYFFTLNEDKTLTYVSGLTKYIYDGYTFYYVFYDGVNSYYAYVDGPRSSLDTDKKTLILGTSGIQQYDESTGTDDWVQDKFQWE